MKTFIYGFSLGFSLILAIKACVMSGEIVSGNWVNAALTCLAFTWLNPHVYLDTVVLLGSVSSQFSDDIEYFTFGATSTSFVSFFSLGYGTRYLRPVFSLTRSWQILEIIIGIIMWSIAAKLVLMQ